MIDAIQWRPAVGDPSFIGWFTVAAYFLVSTLAFKICASSSKLFLIINERKQKLFWLIVAVIILFLGINKQLDFQSLITEVGRYYAKENGWYEIRREIQFWGIISLLLFSLTTLTVFIFKMGSIIKSNWLAIFGMTLLLSFVLIRAAAFYHVTVFNNQQFNGLLELSGICCIGLAAIRIITNTNRAK